MNTPRFPYRVYTIPVLLLAGAGLLASLYLALSHYRNYTDIDYSSFCALSKAINCDTVSQSSWSVLAGIPLALWGVFAYTGILILALAAQSSTPERRSLWDLLFVVALLCSCADLGFAYISAVHIKAYCLMCLFTYAVSFALLFSIWIIRRRFPSHSLFSGIRKAFFCIRHEARILAPLVVLAAAFICLRIFIPTYWIYAYPELTATVRTGVTEEGHPWIGGAENPRIVIREFTDYQCFQCSKMHFILRSLVNKHPSSLRLIHYHYPMDENFNPVLVKKPFHTGSGMLALLAIASAQQGKFWEVNDSLYAIVRNGIKEFNISKFAGKAGLDAGQLKKDMFSQAAGEQIAADIETGLKNKITGTPAFLIDGAVDHGSLPAEILKKIVELPEP